MSVCEQGTFLRAAFRFVTDSCHGGLSSKLSAKQTIRLGGGLVCLEQGVCRPSGQGCPAIREVGRARRNPSEVCHAGANERPCEKQDKADALDNFILLCLFLEKIED